MDIPKTLKPTLAVFPYALVVGGWVRDQLLGLDSKDLDIEVYGTSYPDLVKKLEPFGSVDVVGKAFGVVKLSMDGDVYDFSLPRRDSKILDQEGHKAILVTPEMDMSPKEAAERRDLTINSLAYDYKTGEILDFFGGQKDLNAKLIRHTSHQFTEDPLRVLRVMQFAARFDFDVADETLELSKTISNLCSTLAKERIGEEFEKLFTRGKNIQKGLNFLRDSNWIENFPTLHSLVNCPQDVEFHPEGDVFTHTALCCNALATFPKWQELPPRERLVYMLGTLCHDLGKPACTSVEFKKRIGRDAIVSPGHDKAGLKPTTELLRQLNTPNAVVKRVLPLVGHHMDHLQVITDEHVRRLAVYMHPESVKGLAFITEADHSGRPPLPAKQPDEMVRIIKKAQDLNCYEAPVPPILQGKHFMEVGIPQGKAIGVLYSAAYEAQLQGKFTERIGAMHWYKENRGKILDNAKLGPTRLLSGKDLQASGMLPGPIFGKLHKEVYEQQLDGNIKTNADVVSFITNNAEAYKLVPEVINKLQHSLDLASAPSIDL